MNCRLFVELTSSRLARPLRLRPSYGALGSNPLVCRTGFSETETWPWQNHQFLSGVRLAVRPESAQALASAEAGRFLADIRTALRTVPSPIPSCWAIQAQECPSARRDAILARSTVTRGRPRRVPLAFAAARPDRTRSRMSSCSNLEI